MDRAQPKNRPLPPFRATPFTILHLSMRPQAMGPCDRKRPQSVVGWDRWADPRRQMSPCRPRFTYIQFSVLTVGHLPESPIYPS